MSIRKSKHLASSVACPYKKADILPHENHVVKNHTKGASNHLMIISAISFISIPFPCGRRISFEAIQFSPFTFSLFFFLFLFLCRLFYVANWIDQLALLCNFVWRGSEDPPLSFYLSSVQILLRFYCRFDDFFFRIFPPFLGNGPTVFGNQSWDRAFI